MVKNQTPNRSMAKTPQNKPGPQSMKKGGSPNKPTPGKPSPKQQMSKPAFPTPKQSLNFQTPKQTPKGQQTPGKKQQQQSGKKITTPHPVKGKPQESDDDDDEEDFDSDEDEYDLSLEDEESDSGEKPTNGAAKKLAAKQVPGKKGQLASPPKKATNGAQEEDSDDDDEEDEDFDSDDEEIDEMSSEEDEEESDEDETPVKGAQIQKQKQAVTAQKPGAATAQKPGQAAAAQKGKAVAQAPQKQQASKQVKRPAPEEESDDEDEEDEDEEDEDEEETDEEDEEDESDEEVEVAKGTKKGQQQPQKKLKTNEGSAVAVKPKQEKKEINRMPTKLDKKLQEETEERRRDRDRRSLYIKNFPRGTSDEDIKALSSDIIYVNRKGSNMRWCWVAFANEQVCDKNYEKLKNAKLGKADLFIDYCGEKSKAGIPKQNAAEQRVDALRLYVGNMPSDVAEADLKRLFPSASSVHCRPDRKFAFVNFETPEKARQAFENSKDAKINGLKVVVAYARMPDEKKKAGKKDPVKKFAEKQASGKVISRG